MKRVAAFALLCCTALVGAALPGNSFRPVPGAAIGTATPWTAAPVAEPETLRFAVIGDRTGLARPGVFEQAMNQIGWMRPEFVINAGDLIEGYTDDKAEIAGEWDHIKQAVASLGVPFFYVPGNHDLGTDAELQVWRERHGSSYYAFEYKNVLFLCLDTEDPPMPMSPEMSKQFRGVLKALATDPVNTEKAINAQLAQVNKSRALETTGVNGARFSDAQVDFARRTLAAHRNVRWTFVLMHKPAWTLNSAAFDKIEAMLADRKYTVIAGHNHYYRHEVRKGRDYFQMGTVGAISHQEGPGKMDHLAWVTVDKTGPHYALVRLTGLLDKNGETGQTLAR